MNVQLTIDVGGTRTSTAARSSLYKHLSLAFRYPHDEAVVATFGDAGRRDFEQAARLLPHAAAATMPPFRMDEYTLTDLQLRYTYLFESAHGAGAASLHESACVDSPRAQVWEDLIRFYEHFGLRYEGNTTRLWPDHLVTELECLHYLSFLEAGLASDTTPILRAQRDFIERHPLSWLPRLAQRLAAAERAEPYAGLVALLVEYLAAECTYLRETLRDAGVS